MSRLSAEKRDAYVHERRERILDAALRTFAQKGFADTTVSEIASAAGIAKGTIYLYFESKESLLDAVISERSFIPELASLLADTTSPLEQTLSKIGHRWLSCMANWLPIMRLVITDARLSSRHLERIYHDVIGKAAHMLADLLRSQAQAGEIGPIADPYLTARAFWGMLVAHPVTQELLGGKAVDPLDREAWVREVVRLFLSGLSR